jgi:hypothetical protein
MCGHEGHHQHGHSHDCGCGGACQCGAGGYECGCGDACQCGCDCAGEHGGFRRRYQTKAEQIAELESYLADLKAELQAVEERLADLRK